MATVSIGIITADIKESVFFNLVSPSDVYENLLNYGKFTTKKCQMSDEVGASFSLYDDTIQRKFFMSGKSGKNLLKNIYKKLFS